ncbi:hormone-sensitive lipase [Kwoniella mangroviensis CBS 10435]|uniref:Hormone-sensitive lipase n=1 Tax=Kwoniella mangroviensis CBS 10435 TaxID=1331196 RepID=A0A1B9IIE3_9TREE|nr:hormone-sensitive lipase [Kwoniella mangroviensis CBS 10435]
MIDHILGRPSPALRRTQIFLVLFFWIWRLYKGDGAPRSSLTRSAISPSPSQRAQLRGPQNQRAWIARLWVKIVGRRMVRWIGNMNEKLKHFTPYQLILGTLTLVYALRHLDDLLGLGAPEPLARLYTRSYYRATYVNTAFDAGFASAMSIRPKWLKDIFSMLFTGYYLVWATEGDEVLRRFRAVCSVEMLRVTWEKTKNPYVRLLTTFHRPRLPIIRHLTIPRPPTSSRSNLPSVKAMLFFNGTDAELAAAQELVVDYPGGGFVAMGPDCHEERLRTWAKRTGKPVLSVDYGKAPEYPYPWAIEEGFDAYRTLMETQGRCIGIESGKLGVVLTGDSAGGNICATIMLRILEHPTGIPKPVSMILAYPALDFNFTSWMSPTNLRVLRTEQSETQIPGLVHGKDHMRHKSPLSVVNDIDSGRRRSGRQRQKSWAQTISGKLPNLMSPADEKKPNGGTKSTPATPSTRIKDLPRSMSAKVVGWLAGENGDSGNASEEEEEEEADDDQDTVKPDYRPEAERSLADRVKTPADEKKFIFSPVESPKPVETPDLIQEDKDNVDQIVAKKRKKLPIGTRLTMTSRVGYFQDRIISPSMMRAMAILYVGPRRNPDFETNYYISPILSPPHLLAHFPPVYLICGERDPFVDDTIIFAGKIREAKKVRRSQAEYTARGRSAKHGEYLQMSTGKSKTPIDDLPDPILRESDDNWVQLRIIEGWGHGFMQMSSLMREVDPVLIEMADWIDESFIRHSEKRRDMEEVAAAHQAAQQSLQAEERVILVPEDHLMPPNSMHVKPSRNYKKSPSSTPLGNADLGSSYLRRRRSDAQEDGESDNDVPEDNLVTFTPKAKDKPIKRRLPPPSKFHPVPRRPSKERLDLHRSNSMPKFDTDETGSSGEAMLVKTPPLQLRNLPYNSGQDEGKKGSGAFAFFGGGGDRGSTRSNSNRIPNPPPHNLFGLPLRSESLDRERRLSGGSMVSAPATTGSGTPLTSSSVAQQDKPKNSLVAAAVAGARAASPALAAAGFVPQKVGDVSEAELMRRRRMEAVYGIGGVTQEQGHDGSEGEEEEEMG